MKRRVLASHMERSAEVAPSKEQAQSLSRIEIKKKKEASHIARPAKCRIVKLVEDL